MAMHRPTRRLAPDASLARFPPTQQEEQSLLQLNSSRTLSPTFRLRLPSRLGAYAGKFRHVFATSPKLRHAMVLQLSSAPEAKWVLFKMPVGPW